MLMEMKRTIIPLLICFLLQAPLFAQPKTPIIIHKRGMSSQYFRDGHKLSGSELRLIMTNDQYASETYSVSRTHRLISQGLAITALPFLVVAGGTNDMTLALGALAVSLGICGVVIPFSISANRKMDQAVQLYNAQGRTPGYRSLNLEIGPNTYGVGLTFSY